MPIAAGPHAWIDEVDEPRTPNNGHVVMIRVTIEVPFELKSMADAQLDISASVLQLIGPHGGDDQVRVLMPEGFILDPQEALAKYSKKKRQLTVTSPNRCCKSATREPVNSTTEGPSEKVGSAAEIASRESGGDAPNIHAATAELQVAGLQSAADDDDDDDDLPPPLEAARSTPTPAINSNSYAPPLPAEAVAAWTAQGGVAAPADETNDAAEALMQRALSAREQKRKETEQSRKNADLSAGGGLKKGFLSGNADKSKKKAPADGGKRMSDSQDSVRTGDSDEIIYVGGAADPEAARRQSLQLPEVQSALQGASKFKNDQSWVTPQLMQALQSRPDLLRGLSNPKVMEAMSLMQSDPAAAQKKFAGDPDVASFLKEFSGLMATHFDVLSKNPPASKESSVSAAPAQVVQTGTQAAAKSQEQVPAKSQEFLVLEDPGVQEAFSNPEVQQLIAEIRAGKQIEIHELARSNPRLMHQIKILIDKGLLSFER